MRSMLHAALAVPCVLLSACAFAQTKGSGASQEQKREVGAFERVHIASGLKATVTQGDTAVSLSGDENLLALVETEVEDGELEVRLKRGHSLRGEVRVTISTPKLTEVEATGGSIVEAQASAQETFEAEASGGSIVTVSRVDSRKLAVEASGGSRVTVKGRAEEVDAEVSGGSVVRADEVEMASLTVDASGGARVEAGPSKRLQGDLSGGSVVRLSRSPAQREVETSGGSEVELDK